MKKHLFPILLAILFYLNAVPATFRLHGDIPVTSGKGHNPDTTTSLPTLGEFILQVSGGSAHQVTGIYADGLFAFAVVQQPAGQPAFVSLADDEVTQFSLATSAGSLGFLAHNTLAGAAFSSLTTDHLISVIHGDGKTLTFQVTAIRRFQAVSPASPYSSFVDLASRQTLTASALFQQIYGVRDTLILQTCIASGGKDNWGRLFIIATPVFAGTSR